MTLRNKSSKIELSKRTNLQMRHRVNSKEHLKKIQEHLQKCESPCNEAAAMRYALRDTAARLK